MRKWRSTLLGGLLGAMAFGLVYYFASYRLVAGSAFRTLWLPVLMGFCVGMLLGHARGSRGLTSSPEPAEEPLSPCTEGEEGQVASPQISPGEGGNVPISRGDV